MFAVLTSALPPLKEPGLLKETGNPSIAAHNPLTEVSTQQSPPVPPVTAPTVTERKAEETWRTFTATAYVADCDGCSGITYTGVDVRHAVTYEGHRVIAVDPAVIPLGSAVDVRLTDGTIIEATAQDVGAAIRGERLDILMPSTREAVLFGKQSAEVRVIDGENKH